MKEATTIRESIGIPIDQESDEDGDSRSVNGNEVSVAPSSDQVILERKFDMHSMLTRHMASDVIFVIRNQEFSKGISVPSYFNECLDWTTKCWWLRQCRKSSPRSSKTGMQECLQ